MPWKSHPAINKVLAAWFKGAELVAAWLVAGRPVSWSQMRCVANENLEEEEEKHQRQRARKRGVAKPTRPMATMTTMLPPHQRPPRHPPRERWH
jgi:hypothetical protein